LLLAFTPGHDSPCAGHNNSGERKVYMDYNATTPLVPEVIQVVTEAMHKAWGNPSSSYTAYSCLGD
uniref:Selenocysteine lyase n=1 Tax=Sphenodon punctatus TaxID=8508 RepID=A0A8D0HE75_SPHPU